MFKDRKEVGISCGTCQFSKLCISRSLNPEVAEKLNKIITKVQFVKKGEHVYRDGEKMSFLYAVHHGALKDYYLDEDGKEYINNFYFPGDIMALEAIPHKKYPFSAVALNDAILCLVPVLELMELMQSTPELLRRFINITSFKMLNDKHIRSSTNAKIRVADFLTNMLYRIEERNNIREEIQLPMSQMDISNMIGMAFETVSRVLHHFQDEKIIKINNKQIHITDRHKLMSLGNTIAFVGHQ